MNISHLCFKLKASWVMQKYYITNTRMMPMHALITIFFDLEKNHSYVWSIYSPFTFQIEAGGCDKTKSTISIFLIFIFGLNQCCRPLVCFAFLPNTSWSLRGNLLKVLAERSFLKYFLVSNSKSLFVSLKILHKIFYNLCKTNSSSHLHFAKNWISGHFQCKTSHLW